ncbi:hypothetical protein I4U23_010457 [Adineta vaga]|nr:hypothetical protein I4U23_010457 [Adineta vaga]
MSNSTSDNALASFEVVKSYIFRTVSIILLITGTISIVCNILLFTRPLIWRQSPCIAYLLASTIADIFGIYTIILLRALAGFQLMPTYSSLFLCKLNAYVSNTAPSCSTWFMVARCWDRYLSSSSSVETRNMSNMCTTWRSIVVITFVVLAVYLGKLYCYEIGLTIIASSCSNKNSLCDTADVCITFIIQFITPLVLSAYFGLRTFFNVRRISRRPRVILNMEHTARSISASKCHVRLCITNNYLPHLSARFNNIGQKQHAPLTSSHFRKELKRILCSHVYRNRIIPLN